MRTWDEVHRAELDSNLFCTMELNRIKAQRRAKREIKRRQRIMDYTFGFVGMSGLLVFWFYFLYRLCTF